MKASETRWTASTFKEMRAMRYFALGTLGLLGLNFVSGAILASQLAGMEINNLPPVKGSIKPEGNLGKMNDIS